MTTLLDELERLSKEATPGPWTCSDDTTDSDVVESWDFYILRQDAAFIEAVRKHIDALIEVARAAKVSLEYEHILLVEEGRSTPKHLADLYQALEKLK